jgi:hypothetical protein
MQDFEASDGVANTNIDATITTTRMGSPPVKTDTNVAPAQIAGHYGLSRKTKMRSLKGKVLKRAEDYTFSSN